MNVCPHCGNALAKKAHADAALAAPVAQPSPGLLMSMAIRYDHGLAIPGHYDQLRSLCRVGEPTHKQRLESTLATMRQLWEEATGNGFYRPEREAEYAALAATPEKGSV